MSMEARRGHQSPWNCSYRAFRATMWVLGIVPGSSGRAATSLAGQRKIFRHSYGRGSHAGQLHSISPSSTHFSIRTLSEAREFFQPLHVQSRTVSVHVPGQEFSTNKEQEFVGRASTFHISEASSVQFLLETASGLRSSIALLVGFSPAHPSLILQSGLAHLSDAPFLQISGSTPGSTSSLASSNLYG